MGLLKTVVQLILMLLLPSELCALEPGGTAAGEGVRATKGADPANTGSCLNGKDNHGIRGCTELGVTSAEKDEGLSLLSLRSEIRKRKSKAGFRKAETGKETTHKNKKTQKKRAAHHASSSAGKLRGRQAGDSALLRKKKASRRSALLRKKKASGRRSRVLRVVRSEAFQSKLISWRTRQDAVERAMNVSRDVIDDFIAENAGSADACHARLLEAKRVLDGISAKAKELGAKMKAYEEVLETEATNLNITEATITSVRRKWGAEEEKCNRLLDAEAEVTQYAKELEELRQMADPQRRGNLDELVSLTEFRAWEKMKKKTKKHEGAGVEKRGRAPPAGLGFLDPAQCTRFLAFQKAKKLATRAQDGGRAYNGTDDCIRHRGELQEEFTEAYREISVLKDEAQARLDSYGDCKEDVTVELSSELGPLTTQRSAATQKIEASNDGVSTTSPLLGLVRGRLEKLQAHLAEMSEKCKDSSQVSNHLERVRDLVDSLSECPGQGDFWLRVPGDAGIPDLGEISIFKVQLPKGVRCTGTRIVDACTQRGMKPLCNTAGYAKSSNGKCWPALDTRASGGKNYATHSFAHPPHNRAVGLDPNKLAGMCFYAWGGPGGALYNSGSASHVWTNQNPSPITRPDGEPGLDGKSRWTVQDQDAAGWFTACAKL